MCGGEDSKNRIYPRGTKQCDMVHMPHVMPKRCGKALAQLVQTLKRRDPASSEAVA